MGELKGDVVAALREVGILEARIFATASTNPHRAVASLSLDLQHLARGVTVQR